MTTENAAPRPRRIMPGGALEEIDVEAQRRAEEERRKETEERNRMSADYERPEVDPQERVAAALEDIRGQLREVADLLRLQLAAMDEAAKERAAYTETLNQLRNAVDPPATPPPPAA